MFDIIAVTPCAVRADFGISHYMSSRDPSAGTGGLGSGSDLRARGRVLDSESTDVKAGGRRQEILSARLDPVRIGDRSWTSLQR